MRKQPTFVEWAHHTIIILFLGISLCTQSAFAGLPEGIPGSRAAAMGNTGVSIVDIWSVFNNQAGLAYLDYPSIGLHHENRFISPDLSFSALGFVYPVKPGTFGLSVKRLGFTEFSQTKAGLAYGMKLAPRFSAGVQINMHNINASGVYGQTSAFSVEAGLHYTPSKNLSVGVHVVNPSRSKIYDDERIPTIFNLGIAYKLGEKVILTGAAEKNLDVDPNFKAGLEYSPINNLFFRTGFSTNPSLLSFGLGYNYRGLQFDFAFSKHQYLGYTPQVSLSYIFGAKSANAVSEPKLP